MENKRAKNSEERIAATLQLITINERLLAKMQHDPVSTYYYCRVDDISDYEITITWPTKRGIRMPVYAGQVLELSFERDGLAYGFTILVNETRLKPLPQITTTLTSSISQIQRREHFRIKCLVPVEVLGRVEQRSLENEEIVRIVAIETETFDLSAGGFSIHHSESIPEDCVVETRLALPDNGPVIKAPCEAVHIRAVAGEDYLYHIGLHYLYIMERERARIVRYLLGLQLRDFVERNS